MQENRLLRFAVTCVVAALTARSLQATQDAATPGTKLTEHLIGTISAVDAAAHTITVKEDKSATETVILVANTRTLLKVAPGAKDLKSASRITSDELAPGDRVDVRGSKPPDDPGKIVARSVVLMSARELQVAHQAQAAEWQTATAGVVSGVDAAAGKITITQRTPAGPKPVLLAVSPQTEFTRYSPDAPGTPTASSISQIEPGDQVRVIGDKSDDGAMLTAKRIYSGAFRTINGTVVSVGSEGTQLTVRDLASKEQVNVTLNATSSIQKIPPEFAAGLARRLSGGGGANSSTGGASPGSTRSGATPPSSTASSPPSGASTSAGAAPNGGPPPMRSPRGDMSQMLERLPKITAADLKPGDAVVVSGVATGSGNSQLIATHVIAGVEPILQSAPARQRGQALGGDWGLGEMTAPQ